MTEKQKEWFTSKEANWNQHTWEICSDTARRKIQYVPNKADEIYHDRMEEAIRLYEKWETIGFYGKLEELK
jgi:hypothetical protein